MLLFCDRFFFKYENMELGEVINEELKRDEDVIPLLEGKIQVDERCYTIVKLATHLNICPVL
jgi:hypothetical protein